MEKRPNYLVKIVGNDWDKDGMSVSIDIEDQCRGCITFAFDGENVQGRMYGECMLTDLATVIYMLKKEYGEDAYDVAAEVADRMMEVENNEAAKAGECEGLRGLSGQDGGLQGDVHGPGGAADNEHPAAQGEDVPD